MAEQAKPRAKRVEFKVHGARPVPMTREAKEILVKALRAAGSPLEVREVAAGSLYRTLPNVLLVTLTDEAEPAKKPRAPLPQADDVARSLDLDSRRAGRQPRRIKAKHDTESRFDELSARPEFEKARAVLKGLMDESPDPHAPAERERLIRAHFDRLEDPHGHAAVAFYYWVRTVYDDLLDPEKPGTAR